MEEDTMTGKLPKFLEPEPKLGMGKFADTLSRRSLSTSTPCVHRSASAMTVEDDSGYAESLVDSICFSESTTSSSHYTDSTFDMQRAAASGDCSSQVLDFNYKLYGRERTSSGSKAIPKMSIDFYSGSMKFPNDWEMDDEAETSLTDCSVHHSNLFAVPNVPRSDLDDTNIEGKSSPSVDSHIAARLSEVLKHFSPIDPGRVIGRKMLLEHVDIIEELHSRSLNTTCLSVIFGYLDPEDLCRVCEVTKAWRKACHNDPVAHCRRLKYLRRRQKLAAKGGKENLTSSKSGTKSHGLTRTGSHPFHEMQMVVTRQQAANMSPSKMVTPTKWELYEKAAQTLRNDESLRSCRKCSHPSKVSPSQERAICQNPLCGFDFCICCFSDFHGSSPCVPVVTKKTKTDIVGSKKSKKNLRRLGR